MDRRQQEEKNRSGRSPHFWRRGWHWFAASTIVFALAGGCGPVWYLDPAFGERTAAKEKKPLLFYFKAWDSTQHRNMQLEVLGNAAVKKELMDTVNVELEFAWVENYRKKYGVQRPQMCVMCDPDGKKVSTPLYVNPVPTPEKFVEWLQRSKAAAMGKPPPESKPATRPPPSKP